MQRKKYLKRTWTHPDFKIGKSKIESEGLFTSVRIKKGEVVMIMGGELFKGKEIDSNKYHIATVFPIDDDLNLGLPITDKFEGLDEYLNHSCDPNVWLIDEVTVVARRDIEVGEEITLDAATWYCDEEEKILYSDNGICLCQSNNCRKTITYNDWQKKELQEKYKGHFAPYIQRKIDKANQPK